MIRRLIILLLIVGCEKTDTPEPQEPIKEVSTSERNKLLGNYYGNGQLKSEGNYKDGKEDGKWTFYHGNGQIWYAGNYKNGKKDGKWTFYGGEKRYIYKEVNYKNGNVDGERIFYNEDGSIYKVEEYKDGELVK